MQTPLRSQSIFCCRLFENNYHKDGNLQALLWQIPLTCFTQESLEEGRQWYSYIWMPMELTENASILSGTGCENFTMLRFLSKEPTENLHNAMERWIVPRVSFSKITLTLLESGLAASKWSTKLEVHM